MKTKSFETKVQYVQDHEGSSSVGSTSQEPQAHNAQIVNEDKEADSLKLHQQTDTSNSGPPQTFTDIVGSNIPLREQNRSIYVPCAYNMVANTYQGVQCVMGSYLPHRVVLNLGTQPTRSTAGPHCQDSKPCIFSMSKFGFNRQSQTSDLKQPCCSKKQLQVQQHPLQREDYSGMVG